MKFQKNKNGYLEVEYENNWYFLDGKEWIMDFKIDGAKMEFINKKYTPKRKFIIPESGKNIYIFDKWIWHRKGYTLYGENDISGYTPNKKIYEWNNKITTKQHQQKELRKMNANTLQENVICIRGENPGVFTIYQSVIEDNFVILKQLRKSKIRTNKNL